MIYLDWNATTPPAQSVLDAMQSATTDGWANPASVHGAGRSARAHVERARAAVAELLGFDVRDVVLTSGGTEANNLALRSFVSSEDAALVVGVIEHPSVVRVAEALEREGHHVVWLEPDPQGVVPPEAFARALDSLGTRAKLLSLQAVNHETGVIQPVAEVAELARSRGARFHCDAVQAAGRLPPSSWAGADLVTLAGHKLRGPKGIGALAHRAGLTIRPVLLGGGQERGARPGTQDPVACSGLAEAARRAVDGPDRHHALGYLRDRFEASVTALAPGRVRVNGAGRRAPHVTNLSVEGWRGPELAAALDLEGVCVSSGAACSAGTPEPSPVLTAMVGQERARSAIRVSLGETTTATSIDAAIEAFSRVFRRG